MRGQQYFESCNTLDTMLVAATRHAVDSLRSEFSCILTFVKDTTPFSFRVGRIIYVRCMVRPLEERSPVKLSRLIVARRPRFFSVCSYSQDGIPHSLADEESTNTTKIIS